MVSSEEILCMEFLKKTEFTGCCEGMRYRLEKKMEGEGDAAHPVLLATVWPEPFNYHSTPEEKKRCETFSFDRDGVEDAVAWMNNILFEHRDLFERAFEKWDEYVLPKFPGED